MQTDRATAVCCAYIEKVHCAVVRTTFYAWWVTFGKYFRWKGTILSNPVGLQRFRDIPVLYGVEILTENYSVLSQYTHLTDGQNCNSNTGHCITCSRMVKWCIQINTDGTHKGYSITTPNMACCKNSGIMCLCTAVRAWFCAQFAIFRVIGRSANNPVIGT